MPLRQAGVQGWRRGWGPGRRRAAAGEPLPAQAAPARQQGAHAQLPQPGGPDQGEAAAGRRRQGGSAEGAVCAEPKIASIPAEARRHGKAVCKRAEGGRWGLPVATR